jgi:hypothetical protein
MNDDVIAQLRQLPEEEISCDLRSLGLKLDGISRQIEESRAAISMKLEAVRLEQVALREQMKALRDEAGTDIARTLLIH